MKRLLALLTILPCLLCSCDILTLLEKETTAPTETETTTVPQEDLQPDTPLYNTPESIPRFTTNSFQRGYYGFSDSDLLLTFQFPTEWTMQKSIDGLTILHGENTVGKVVEGNAADTNQWETLSMFTRHTASGSTLKIVESKEVDGIPVFRYRYVYSYGSGKDVTTATLTAACAAIGSTTEQKLTNGGFTNKYTNPVCGTLMHLDSPRSILVLGNSFIGSSEIVSILREMLSLNGKNCTVYDESRGNALVGTFTNDENLMNEIRAGAYDLVLTGGFYGGTETVQEFSKLRAACTQSDTALVIFPAHNENESVIAMAQSGPSSTLCLHWKKELDLLIENGIDRWDLCWDDYYDHSKPLAGYVGAHMIYRALYGEAPTKALKSSISQSEVNRILGDYITSKDLRICAEKDIVYIS